ncbi:hypothetical protein F5I97DRAFT_1485204 [Phlebopus sp. FC_14]|nr:hypothetical protein F5I97DRAFT_1485204 [Phlebopus sp. FC_14]
MSQEFNTDFTEQDHYELIRIGLENRTHYCGWWSNGRTCNAIVRGGDISAHLRLHGVWDQTRYTCLWGDCDRGEFNRDCLIRHIQEKHLEWKWICVRCDAIFTRRSVLNRHLRSH